MSQIHRTQDLKTIGIGSSANDSRSDWTKALLTTFEEPDGYFLQHSTAAATLQ